MKLKPIQWWGIALIPLSIAGFVAMVKYGPKPEPPPARHDTPRIAHPELKAGAEVLVSLPGPGDLYGVKGRVVFRDETKEVATVRIAEGHESGRVIYDVDLYCLRPIDH